jgi:hypothetical protein
MNSLKTVLVLLALPLLLTLFEQSRACSPGKVTNMTQDNSSIPPGLWGGEHIRLQVTDKGAEVAYDCAHGTIDAPIALNSKGSFDIRGGFVPERSGPIRREQQSNNRPARYVGEVDGDTMTLTVTLTDSSEKVGPFTLTRGSRGRLFKCR